MVPKKFQIFSHGKKSILAAQYNVSPQRLTSTFFDKYLNGYPQRDLRSEEIFSKMLILVFEVIVQPPDHTFQITFFLPLLGHCGSNMQHGMAKKLQDQNGKYFFHTSTYIYSVNNNIFFYQYLFF